MKRTPLLSTGGPWMGLATGVGGCSNLSLASLFRWLMSLKVIDRLNGTTLTVTPARDGMVRFVVYRRNSATVQLEAVIDAMTAEDFLRFFNQVVSDHKKLDDAPRPDYLAPSLDEALSEAASESM